jgi:hypothetical protein
MECADIGFDTLRACYTALWEFTENEREVSQAAVRPSSSRQARRERRNLKFN